MTEALGSAGGVADLGVIGLGVDLVDVARFACSLQRTPGLAQRLFSQDEIAYADRFTSEGRAQRLAARFAAKEAVMKSLGVGLGAFAFRDVAVQRDAAGRPSLSLDRGASKAADEAGVVGWLVSLSHTATLAQATALALGRAV